MNQIIEYNQENRGPLRDVRVLDFTMLLPGPLCTMYLGDFGADVVKVEHPIAIDNTRKMGPYFLRIKTSILTTIFLIETKNPSR
jgi:crotonobetainyl-CoA:carnitine CoA-transferase CaiB-like acyl-CoA transferase